MTTTARLFTTTQVATLLGKSPRTIHRMADTGRLPYVAKLTGTRGAYVFEPAVVEQALREAMGRQTEMLRKLQEALA